MNRGDWVKEVARDIIALGGLPFFILVLTRIWILDKPEYFLQFFVAGIVFGLVFLWLKQDSYAGLSLITVFFTSFYYDDFLYTLVVSVAYLLLLGSLIYLGRDWKKVGFGVLIGIFGIVVSFIYPYL
jgi:hypothetical protein